MAEDSEFRKIWADAFDIYKAETHRDIKGDPVLQNLNSTEDLLAQINDYHQDFSDFREKRRQLWTVLHSIMKPLELLGGLTQDALTLTPFSPCSQVLGAVLYLVKAAKGVSAAYDCITNLLEALKAFTDRLQEYTKATVESKLKKIVTHILTTLLEVFARSEKLISRGRFKQYLRSNEEVDAAMSRLEKLMDAEEKLVIALNYSTTRGMDKKVERNGQTLDGIVGTLNESQKESKEQAEKNREEAEKKRISKCLYSKEAMTGISEHEKVSAKRLEPSGEWIKEEPLFQDWLAKNTPLLWILGSPGSGKSFLSSRIISYLQELYPQDSKHPSRVSVGYFYVKEDNQYLRSLATILKSLAFQIQGNDSVYKKYVANVCNSPEKIITARSLWKKCFIDFFASLQYRDSSTFLVIDGLDEAPRDERQTLIELLEVLKDVSGQNVRPRIQIVLVGRHELLDDINFVWSKNINNYVDVSASKNSKDIRNYIAKGLKRVRALKNIHLEEKERIRLRQEIVDKITQGANGMFLWVNLMFEQINNKSRPSDISKALDSAPPNVSAMIRHVFERLSGDPDVGEEDLNEMLLWVTCAQRPLSLGEMHAIMKLRSPIGEDLPNLEELLRIKFASFFILERKDKRTTDELLRLARNTYAEKILSAEEENVDSDDLEGDLDSSASFNSDFETTIVKFSHASIRDYLVQEGTPEKSKYSRINIGFDMSQAEQHIAATCLSILCSKVTKPLDEVTSLVEYAADHFMEHLIQLNKSTMSQKDRQMILRPLFLLFSDESIIDVWLDKISDFVLNWFKKTKFSACVRDWFGEEDAFGDDFTSEERAAMMRMAQSDKELFRPLARYCASTWQNEKEVEEDTRLKMLIKFLRVYVTIDDYAKKDEDNNRIGFDRLWLQTPSVSQIRELAQFIEFEKTALWHARLAKALWLNNHLEAAVQEYHETLRIDEGSLLAKLGLADCYEKRMDHKLAIDWMLKALVHLRDDRKDEKSDLWQRISQVRVEIGDEEGAIEAAKEALRLDPDSILATYVYLSALDAGGRFQELLDFVHDLEKASPGIEKHDLLFYAILGIDMLGNAAAALGRLDFVSNVIETSIAVVDEEDAGAAANQRYQLGRFKFRWLRDTDESIKLWESALESTADTISYEYWFPRSECIDLLSQVYFDRAVKLEKQGLSPGSWVSKLERLCTIVKGSEEDDYVISTESASTVLGLWYRLHDAHDKAKDCFRPLILEAIDILTDDDPDNDVWGYAKLAPALLKAGDKANACSAFVFAVSDLEELKDARQAMQKNQAMVSLEENRTGNKKVPEGTLGVKMNSLIIGTEPDSALAVTEIISEPLLTVEPTSRKLEPASDKANDESAVPPNDLEVEQSKPKIPFLWYCDGICKSKREAWMALYFCEVCLDTMFCDQCLELVQTDRLPFQKCSSDHTFYQIYPSAQKMDMKTVVVDGKTLLRTEWLANLRKEWEG